MSSIESFVRLVAFADKFDLADTAQDHEVLHAIDNLRAGHHPRDLLCSLATLIEATQTIRAEDPDWGSRFRKDPRRFSSTPRIATPEQVGAFIDGVRIQ